MRNFRLLRASLVLFVLCLLLPGRLAYAAPCAISDVAALIGTICTIGDKTFNFADTSGAVSTGTFLFTPDASNALSPSFTIAATAAGGFTLSQANAEANFRLFFDVSTTSGSPTLVGLDVTVNGIVSGGTPTPGTAGGGTFVDATNESNLALTPLVFPEACIQSGGGFSGCVQTTGSGSSSAVGTFVGGPVSSESGVAGWFLNTDATGTATFLSATYSFDQQPTRVPEPTMLALLAAAFAGMGLARRRRPY